MYSRHSYVPGARTNVADNLKRHKPFSYDSQIKDTLCNSGTHTFIIGTQLPRNNLCHLTKEGQRPQTWQNNGLSRAEIGARWLHRGQ